MATTSIINVDETTNKLVKDIISKSFKHLELAFIKVLFDQKKRKNGGRHTVASLKKPDELVRYLSSTFENNGEGYDYILLLDERVFNVLDKSDKRRLICHTLHHADIDFESDNPYKLRKPDIQAFSEEINDIVDDPQWMNRIQAVAESVYCPDKEQSPKPSFMI